MSIRMGPDGRKCSTKKRKNHRNPTNKQSKREIHKTVESERESGFSPTPNSAQSKLEDVEIGAEIRRAFMRDPSLERSVRVALERLNSRLEGANISTYLEHDREDTSRVRPVIQVNLDISNVEEWMEYKKMVREIVRQSEQDNTMIYTLVEKKA